MVLLTSLQVRRRRLRVLRINGWSCDPWVQPFHSTGSQMWPKPGQNNDLVLDNVHYVNFSVNSSPCLNAALLLNYQHSCPPGWRDYLYYQDYNSTIHGSISAWPVTHFQVVTSLDVLKWMSATFGSSFFGGSWTMLRFSAQSLRQLPYNPGYGQAEWWSGGQYPWID